MSDATYTHKDLSSLLGVSETTVKSYRRKFPGCIPVANKGKPIRFTDEALAVATRIRDLFETGMSVDEVRSRPAAEFSFISQEAPQDEDAAEGAHRPGKGGDVTPELSLGVSNMAKSMVAMTQQQKAILSRMQGIESMLEDLGLLGDPAQSQRAEKAKERQEFIESRLDTLDSSTRELAQTVQNLAGQLGRFLGKREKAAEEWAGGGSQAISDAARLAAQAIAASQATTSPGQSAAGQQERAGAQVIPLRPDKKTEPQRPQSNLVPGQAAVPEGPSEPPRQFFGMPLVARTEQGQYISAGGKTRGRFSLNDLKAMLIYGFTPPNHFTLRWERHGQGWWLYLEQENSDRAIHLLLMEIPTQKGGSVVEILQIRQGDDTQHPAEICSIIDSFGA